MQQHAKGCRPANGCNPLLFTVLASQTRGHAMNFFVEAKHPHEGGMVLVLCRTRDEALQAIANLKKEGYVDVKGTGALLGTEWTLPRRRRMSAFEGEADISLDRSLVSE
jgi:hypothetical protein